MKTTGWFPLSVKPERIGVYEVWEDGVGVVGKMVWVWDRWYWPNAEFEQVWQWNNFKWRGLKEPA